MTEKLHSAVQLMSSPAQRIVKQHTPTPPSTPPPGRPSSKGRRIKKSEAKLTEMSETKEKHNKENNANVLKDNGPKSLKTEKTVKPPKQSKDKQPTPATTSEQRSLSPRKTWTKDFTILDDFQKTCNSYVKRSRKMKRLKNRNKGHNPELRSHDLPAPGHGHSRHADPKAVHRPDWSCLGEYMKHGIISLLFIQISNIY